MNDMLYACIFAFAVYFGTFFITHTVIRKYEKYMPMAAVDILGVAELAAVYLYHAFLVVTFIEEFFLLFNGFTFAVFMNIVLALVYIAGSRYIFRNM